MPNSRLRSAFALAAVIASAVMVAPAAAETGQPVGSVSSGGATITGRVTDSAGRPLTHVSIDLVTPSSYVTTTTGLSIGVIGYGGSAGSRDGRFSIVDVKPGAYLVCYSSDFNHVTGGTSKNGYRDYCSRRTINPAAGSTVRLPTVRLAAVPPHGGVSIRGQVEGFDGHRGLSLAIVVIEQKFSISVYEILTPHGAFSLTNLPIGRTTVCGSLGNVTTRRAPTGYTSRCRVIGRPKTSHLNVTLRLPLGAAIGGHARSTGGAPLGRVVVDALRGQNIYGEARTNGHGGYRMNGLPAGRYRVCFTPSGTGPGAPTGSLPACHYSYLPIQVGAGQFHGGVDQRLAPAGAISGRVTNGNQRTAVGAFTADLTTGYVVGAHEGAYRINGLPAGGYHMCAQAVDFAGTSVLQCAKGLRKVHVSRVHRDVAIALPKTGSIATSIVDARGRPVAGTNVAVFSPCHGLCTREPLFDPKHAVSVQASSMTGSDGRAKVTLLRPGKYAVCAFAYYGAAPGDVGGTGYADRCASKRYTVVVRPGRTTPVRLRLDRGGAVTGVVTDSAGKPVAGVDVNVASSAATDYTDEGFGAAFGFSTPRLDARTDAHGRYTIYSVAAGARRVCVDGARVGYGSACLGAPVSVTAGRTTTAGALHVAKRGGHIAPDAGPRRAVVFTAPGTTALTGRSLLARFPQLRALGVGPRTRLTPWRSPGLTVERNTTGFPVQQR